MRKKAKTPTKRVQTARGPRKRRAKIVIWKSKKDRKFYFHLESSNGKVVMDNGQGYERRVNLVKTLRSVQDIFTNGRFEIRENA